MIPSIENLFKRGADLYYSCRHSYPLFKIEFRPSIGDEWIYKITIRGNDGKVASYSCAEFNDEVIIRMIKGLLDAEDVAYIHGAMYRNICQADYEGRIRDTGERVHFDLRPGAIAALEEEV